MPPNTNQESIYDCRDECSGRTDAGYIAYVPGSTCACYRKGGGCNADGLHLDHNVFEILDSGKLLGHMIYNKAAKNNLMS